MGFGISTPEQVAQVGRWADAAVVGSALVNVIAEHGAAADSPARVGGIRALAERSGMSGDLDDLRRRIDLLDEQLVRLLNARAACALEIGRLKRETGDRHLPARARSRSARARGGR